MTSSENHERLKAAQQDATQRPEHATQSSEDATQASEYATHTFCSLYTFSVAATEEIFRSFEAIVSPKVKHEVLDGQLFSVTCPKDDDKSYPVLFNIIKTFIETEIGRSPDVFEATKVTRIKGTTTEEDTSSSAETIISSSMFTNGDSTTPNYDKPLIEHETFTRTWTSRGGGRAKLSDFVVSKIGSICHCRIEWSKESASDANIIGDNEQDVGRAISKLSVVDECAIEQMNFPHIVSFVIVEAETSSFKLRMTSLRELKERKDRRGSTTLLSPASRLFRSVEDALVISMIKDHDLVTPNCRQDTGKAAKDNIPILTESERHQDIGKNVLWSKYPFKSFNTQASQDHESATLVEPRAVTPTHEWVAHIPAPTEMGNPYLPEEKKDIPPSVTNDHNPKEMIEVCYKLPSPKPVQKPSTKRARAVKGMATRAKSAWIEPLVESNINDSPVEESGARIDAPGISAPVTTDTKQSLIDIHHPSQKVNEGKESQAIDSENSPLIVPGKNEMAIGEFNQVPTTEVSLETVRTEFIAPEITAPYMPPPTAMRPIGKSSGLEGSDTGWDGNVMRRGAGQLVRMSMPEARPPESKMAHPRYTMNQKAPSRALPGRNSVLLMDFEEAAKQLLASALPRQGPVVFEVGIGRLLINHQIGSPEFKTKPFSLSEWFSAFPVKPGPGGLETRFTPRLTTAPEDVMFILNTRLPKARRLFENNADQVTVPRSTNYVFSCKSKQGNQVTINVDEDGAFKISGGEVVVGSLDFHFPKRSWDASLRLRTSALRSSDYYQQIKGIVRNMKIHVGPDGTILHLSTQTIDEELAIQSIVVRRETLHPSKVYADLWLRLCEVQDLQACKQGYRYDGAIRDREGMIDAGRYWWEASITSVNATSILAENEKLEIGENATWNVDTIIEKGIIRDLFSFSSDLVTRIDSVGFHNKGLKSNLSSRANTTSMKPPELLPGEGFW